MNLVPPAVLSTSLILLSGEGWVEAPKNRSLTLEGTGLVLIPGKLYQIKVPGRVLGVFNNPSGHYSSPDSKVYTQILAEKPFMFIGLVGLDYFGRTNQEHLTLKVIYGEYVGYVRAFASTLTEILGVATLEI